MIIELFGPQGAGKTTFAHAVAAQLQKQGQVVDLVLSYRPVERSHHDPGENPPSFDRAAALAIRLIRPIIELLTMTRHPLAYSYDLATVTKLIRALPPKHFLSAVRLGQYILRLSRSWHQAAASNHIALFDQAFVQAVFSLVLFSEISDEQLIARALDVIPTPDILIQLDAAQDILENRLRTRLRLQSLAERMLEVDPRINIETTTIFNQLHDLLQRRGQPVTLVSSSDANSFSESVNKTAEQIAAVCRARDQSHHLVPEHLPSERCRHV